MPTAYAPSVPAAQWSRPAFLPYVQPALTAEAVRAAEHQLQVRLPERYIQLLSVQNGGYMRGGYGVSQVVAGIGPQFPSITRDDAWWRPRRRKPSTWAPPKPEHLIPFSGDGHWDICFDYRTCGPESDPSVAYVTCESEYEEPIAGSFEAFLCLLEDELIGHVRVYGRGTAETVAAALVKGLGAPAPYVSNHSHGYMEWKITPPASDWFVCSATRVPSGFRRAGDRTIVTEEITDRIAEDPTCIALLNSAEQHDESVLTILRRAGFDGRRI